MSCLRKEEVMGLRSLKQRHGEKLPNTAIATLFQVTEGTSATIWAKTLSSGMGAPANR